MCILIYLSSPVILYTVYSMFQSRSFKTGRFYKSWRSDMGQNEEFSYECAKVLEDHDTCVAVIRRKT